MWPSAVARVDSSHGLAAGCILASATATPALSHRDDSSSNSLPAAIQAHGLRPTLMTGLVVASMEREVFKYELFHSVPET